VFFFIVEKLLSNFGRLAVFEFFPFSGDFLPGILLNYPFAENAAAFYINPGTWLPKEEYT